MSRAIRSISSWVLAAAVLSGCALFEQKSGPKPVTGPQEKVFYGTFEEIWKATGLALQSPKSYPLKVHSMDTGFIETDIIRGSLIWNAPSVIEAPSNGKAYRLVVQVIKGKVSGRGAFKVTVQKVAQLQRDFFSEPEALGSDGLEEKVILYRIGRELTIDRAMKRANSRGS
jgi:hypothetical protein